MSVRTFRVPTDAPESDGTLRWDHTTVVLVELTAGGTRGIGWTYAGSAAASVIEETLKQHVVGSDPTAIEGTWQTMCDAVRNDDRHGICGRAISAVDIALWDLKARLLDLPLIDLFGRVRDRAEIYGSGGFTSYHDARLTEQLGGWAAEGLTRVKMKVGRDAADDPRRVRVARKAIGDGVELFVDANGGYSAKQALAMAEIFAEQSRVIWFEEPVSSDDLAGLHLLRNRAAAPMDIAAGEYGDTPGYFRRMLAAEAVDCLQADATRCGGYTGFFKAAALCEAFHIPLSAHCGPQLHAHIACCAGPLRHIEYFHDHVRIDHLLFDGALHPVNGALAPDQNRAGHGMTLKESDAQRYQQ